MHAILLAAPDEQAASTFERVLRMFLNKMGDDLLSASNCRQADLTPLAYVAARGHEETLGYLLDLSNRRSLNGPYFTPMSLSISCGNMHMVKRLLVPTGDNWGTRLERLRHTMYGRACMGMEELNS